MTQWFRVWHGMPNDPKFRLIAKISDSPLAAVITVFMQLMDRASQAKPRGTVGDVDPSEMAMACDLEDEMTAAILDAMEGRLKLNGRLLGWERRQPEREDRSADRTAAYRARHSASQATGDAPETEKEPEKKQKKDTKPRALNTDYSAAFESWWKEYPRGEGKQGAWMVWKTDISPPDIPDLMRATANYARSNETRYLKHGERFLKRAFWRDFINYEGTSNVSSKRHAAITEFLGYDPQSDLERDRGESRHLLGPGDDGD